MSVSPTTQKLLSYPTFLYRTKNAPHDGPSPLLPKGDKHRLRGDNRWRIIFCHQGKIWITQKNDPEDHILHGGEAFLISQPGLVLIKALQDSEVEISPTLKNSLIEGNYRFSTDLWQAL